MRYFTTALLLAASSSLFAQDVITWVDGTTTDRARVSDFNVIEIKWLGGGSSDKRSSDQVLDLSVAKVQETFKRGYAAKDQNAADTADMFLGVAREEMTKTPFLAQFGLWEAGKFLMEVGKEAEAFPIFDELMTKLPDSGFVPRAMAMKLDYYFTPDRKRGDSDFEWAFAKTGFVLKKGKGAIPADLLGKLLPEGTAADEVRGEWQLTGKVGQRLVLTEIRAGDKAGKKEVELRIYKTAPNIIRVDEPQYVFTVVR